MNGAASLRSIAQALGGSVVGHQILCPGPGHSPKDRSLSVRISPAAPDGFVVHSHCGDDPLACRDHVRAKLGWTRAIRPRFAAEPRPTPVRAVASPSDDTAMIERARAIWNQALDPRGSVVEIYLRSRGLELPAEVAGEALRFHPACPWHDAESGRTIRVPAMIGALRALDTEELTGVHRTRLTPDGRKVDRRMLGKAAGAAIMLCPMSALGDGLAVAEGIETALAGWQLGWSNVWAMGSVGAIASLPALPFYASLTVMAETGDNGASQRAVDTVAARWADAGREVIVIAPTAGGDLNDAIRGAA